MCCILNKNECTSLACYRKGQGRSKIAMPKPPHQHPQPPGLLPKKKKKSSRTAQKNFKKRCSGRKCSCSTGERGREKWYKHLGLMHWAQVQVQFRQDPGRPTPEGFQLRVCETGFNKPSSPDPFLGSLNTGLQHTQPVINHVKITPGPCFPFASLHSLAFQSIPRW